MEASSSPEQRRPYGEFPGHGSKRSQYSVFVASFYMKTLHRKLLSMDSICWPDITKLLVQLNSIFIFFCNYQGTAITVR